MSWGCRCRRQLEPVALGRGRPQGLHCHPCRGGSAEVGAPLCAVRDVGERLREVRGPPQSQIWALFPLCIVPEQDSGVLRELSPRKRPPQPLPPPQSLPGDQVCGWLKPRPHPWPRVGVPQGPWLFQAGKSPSCLNPNPSSQLPAQGGEKAGLPQCHLISEDAPGALARLRSLASSCMIPRPPPKELVVRIPRQVNRKPGQHLPRDLAQPRVQLLFWKITVLHFRSISKSPNLSLPCPPWPSFCKRAKKRAGESQFAESQPFCPLQFPARARLGAEPHWLSLLSETSSRIVLLGCCRSCF